MIDPQGQANKWIKTMEMENSLRIIRFTSSNYINVLEHAIIGGQPVCLIKRNITLLNIMYFSNAVALFQALLENINEELDPILEPVLLKQIFLSGGTNCIKLGDSIIEYNNNFR